MSDVTLDDLTNAIGLGLVKANKLTDKNGAKLLSDFKESVSKTEGDKTTVSIKFTVKVTLDEVQDLLTVVSGIGWAAKRGDSAEAGSVPLGETLQRTCETCRGKGCDNCDGRGVTGESMLEEDE